MVPTRDHQQIRQWAAKHNATPAEINKLKFDGEPAILYFLTGQAAGGTTDLRPISWESFFAQFDLLNLSMAFDDSSPRFSIVRVESASDARQAD